MSHNYVKHRKAVARLLKKQEQYDILVSKDANLKRSYTRPGSIKKT
jgi:hypothetical protein